jgi:hypothetical protein
VGWQTAVAIQLQAGNTIINASGDFIYSSSPATGNLVASVAPAGGTDQFGNNFVAGHATYAANFATSLNGGFIDFYSGSLASGWSVTGSIQTDVFGDILLLAAAGRTVTTTNNTLDDGAGGMAVTSLTVGGSSNTGNPAPNASSSNGLPDGTIHGTSGPASAGTAHTHSPGSFAVGNGVHNHDLQNHDHPL